MAVICHLVPTKKNSSEAFQWVTHPPIRDVILYQYYNSLIQILAQMTVCVSMKIKPYSVCADFGWPQGPVPGFQALYTATLKGGPLIAYPSGLVSDR